MLQRRFQPSSIAEYPADHATPLDDERSLDDDLAARAAGGDERAFELLVQRQRPRLVEVATRIVAGGHAEDAVQLALLSAYRSLRNAGPPRSIDAWLTVLTRNAALDQIRRIAPTEPLTFAHAGTSRSASDAAEARAEVRSVLSAVADLPIDERDALLLRTTAGYGHDEIAAELDVTDGQARQLLYRARRRVREVAAVLLPGWIAFRVQSAKAAVRWPADGAVAALSGSSRGVAAIVAACAATSAVAVGVPAVTHHASRAAATQARPSAGTAGALVPAAGGVADRPGSLGHSAAVTSTEVARGSSAGARDATPQPDGGVSAAADGAATSGGAAAGSNTSASSTQPSADGSAGAPAANGPSAHGGASDTARGTGDDRGGTAPNHSGSAPTSGKTDDSHPSSGSHDAGNSASGSGASGSDNTAPDSNGAADASDDPAAAAGSSETSGKGGSSSASDSTSGDGESSATMPTAAAETSGGHSGTSSPESAETSGKGRSGTEPSPAEEAP